MRIFQSIKNGIGNLIGNVKSSVNQGSSSFRSSAESFIGDIVIRSTFNRLKGGVLNMLNEGLANPSPTQANVSPAPSSAPVSPVLNSTLMAKLLTNLSQPISQAANKVTEELDNTLSNMGEEIAQGVQRTLKEKVESINSDDVVQELGRVFNACVNELNRNPEGRDNVNFNLGGALQVVGLVLMAISMVLLVGGVCQEFANQDQNHEVEGHNPAAQEEARSPILAM